MKECFICKETKDHSCFYTRALTCKDCYNNKRREKREAIFMPKKLLKINRSEKVCTVCGYTKELSMFYKHDGTLDKRTSHCKSCMAKRNKTIQLPYRMKRAKEIKRECLSRLGGSCSSCGLTPSDEWPIECFDFHHVKDKTKLLSQLIMKSVSSKHREELMSEVDKCIILCANCHRKHHAASFIASE